MEDLKGELKVWNNELHGCWFICRWKISKENWRALGLISLPGGSWSRRSQRRIEGSLINSLIKRERFPSEDLKGELKAYLDFRKASYSTIQEDLKGELKVEFGFWEPVWPAIRKISKENWRGWWESESDAPGWVKWRSQRRIEGDPYVCMPINTHPPVA